MQTMPETTEQYEARWEKFLADLEAGKLASSAPALPDISLTENEIPY